jgi:hypothetical protein
MSKYQPLTERLAGHAEPQWRASFAEIEAVLGFPLPRGARAGKLWWANTGAQPHQRAWTGGGWEVGEVADGEVTFRKLAAPAPTGEGEFQPPPAVADEPAILKRLELSPAWNVALVAGGIALVAGLGALMLRGVTRRRS